ncbi:MAG: hypothetical protein ACR2PH_02045, partial [Desulfobulbia bacterium]
MSIEKILERIAVALEAKVTEALTNGTSAPGLVEPENSAPENSAPEAQQQQIMPEAFIHVGPENAGILNPPVQTGAWDPTTSDIQGSYRTADKKGAIAATLEKLGITIAKSASYAKKHRAILDHVAQFGAVQQITWPEFEKQILENNAVVGRDVVLGALQQLEGHQVLAQPNVNPANYAKLLEMTKPQPEPQPQPQPQPQPEPQAAVLDLNPPAAAAAAPIDHAAAPAPVQYAPGMPVNTPEMLASYARHLIIKGADPRTIQQSVAHLAPGVTYVRP